MLVTTAATSSSARGGRHRVRFQQRSCPITATASTPCLSRCPAKEAMVLLRSPTGTQSQTSMRDDSGMSLGASHRQIDTYRRYFGYFQNFAKDQVVHLGAVPQLSALHSIEGAPAWQHQGPPRGTRKLREVGGQAQSTREQPHGGDHAPCEAKQDPRRSEVRGRRAVSRTMLSPSGQGHAGPDGLRRSSPRRTRRPCRCRRSHGRS